MDWQGRRQLWDRYKVHTALSVASLFLVLGTYVGYRYEHRNFIKAQDSVSRQQKDIESLKADLKNERLNVELHRGRLDVICENNPSACEGVE